MMAPTASADPATPDGQATLSLSAVAERRAGSPDRRPSLARVRRSADDDGAHALIVEFEPRPADADAPARRLRRARRLRPRERDQAADARPGGSSDRLGLSAGGFRIGGDARRPADRPVQPFARDLRAGRTAIRRASSSTPRRRPATSSVCPKATITSCRPISTRSAAASSAASAAAHRQIGGARAAGDAPDQFDRQRRHQGGLRQARRRDAAPSLRDA